ncbi:MAG: L-seryl-tRNA(Sec) selenium transferase, partial [Desulfotomaculales bacterium]
FAVTVRPRHISVEELGLRLRLGDPAVLGRIKEDRLFLDVRTLQEGEAELLVRAIEHALAQHPGGET